LGNFLLATASCRKRCYPRYFGDFCEEDVQTPRGATRALKLGQESLSKLRKTCQKLSSENCKLKKQVQTLKEIVRELRSMDYDCGKAAEVITVLY